MLTEFPREILKPMGFSAAELQISSDNCMGKERIKRL